MRLVVRMPNWLGDIVMAMPAIRTVRAHFPDASLALAAPAAFVPFCETIEGVDQVVPLQGKGVRALGAHARSLQAGGFDMAILLTNSFASAWAVRRAGIPERWGYRRGGRGRLLTRAVAPARRRSVHHSAYYLALTEALGMASIVEPGRLALPESVRQDARGSLLARGWDGAARLIVCAPGAAYGTAKQWPAPRWAEAIDAFTARGSTVVLIGSRADRSAGRAITAESRSAESKESRETAESKESREGKLIDLIGATDLTALMGVLSWADAVVSNDSGAMHVASVLGRPVVAVFGPTDERATSPFGRHAIVSTPVWCRPCLLRECPIDHRCMRRIQASTVVEAIDRLTRHLLRPSPDSCSTLPRP